MSSYTVIKTFKNILLTFFAFISRLFDRALFTICFVIGVQLPEFIQQYSQRLSGHLNEAQHHLQQFQVIADLQFQGSLTALIERYQINSDPALVQTGQIVTDLSNRITELTFALEQLKSEGYWQRIVYFSQEVNTDMAKATAEQFIMAIPLTFNALLTGGIFALIVLIIKELIVYLIKHIYLGLFKKSSETI